jgi:copper(I)-binding protein
MTYLAAGLLAAQTMLGTAFAEGISVTDAYLRVTGVKATTAAAFMQIENHSAADDRLIGATTEAAKKAELHTHRQDANGVMSMMEIEGGIALPAGSSHLLQRGEDHVMLMGLTAPLQDSDSIQITLRFETAGEVTITVPVDNARKPGAAMGHGAMGQGATN